jgi:hypothetical protein
MHGERKSCRLLGIPGAPSCRRVKCRQTQQLSLRAARLFIHPTYTAPYRSAAFLIILFEPLEEHPVARAANNEKGAGARARAQPEFRRRFRGCPKVCF